MQHKTIKIKTMVVAPLRVTYYFKFVGHVLDDRFTWVGHVEHICKKLACANFAINSTKICLPLKIRKTLYYSMFDSHLNFGNLLWGCANKTLLNKVENLQKRSVRNILFSSTIYLHE